jgi:hypothetical protein
MCLDLELGAGGIWSQGMGCGVEAILTSWIQGMFRGL